MALKKILTSSGGGIMIIAQSTSEKKFPVGFSYMLDGMIRTVKEDISQDSHTEMRRLQLSNGDQEDVTVETILKDVQSKDCVILSTGKDEPKPASPEQPTETPKQE